LEVTIQELTKLTGIAGTTLRDAAVVGLLPARKLGWIWVVNIDHPKYQEYLVKHRPRGVRRLENQTLNQEAS
jgi:hypothetical protein